MRSCGMSESTVRQYSAWSARVSARKSLCLCPLGTGRLLSSHLSYILSDMVKNRTAVYEPAGQTRSVLLYWRSVDEWAEVLHDWVSNSYATLRYCRADDAQANSTGQLNTILTFYEIIEPPVSSPLSGIPMSVLRKAVNILTKTGRAQLIAVADGEGVRFLQGNMGR